MMFAKASLAIAAAALDGAEDFLRQLGSWIEATNRLADLLLAGARAGDGRHRAHQLWRVRLQRLCVSHSGAGQLKDKHDNCRDQLPEPSDK